MDKLKKKYVRLFQTASESVEEWKVEKEIAMALMNNVSNIIGRLPVLQKSELYEEIEGLSDLEQEVQRAQMEALERAMRRLLDTMHELDKYCGTLKRTARHASQLLQSELNGRKTTQPRGVDVRFGSGPTIKECISFLEKLAFMFEEETSLKRFLVDQISYDTTEEEFGIMCKMFQDDPLMDKAFIGHIFEEAKLLSET